MAAKDYNSSSLNRPFLITSTVFDSSPGPKSAKIESHIVLGIEILL